MPGQPESPKQPGTTGEVHHLASLVGVLGLRWFMVRQSLAGDDAVVGEIQALDETVLRLRESVRRLSALVALPPAADSPDFTDGGVDERAHEHE